MPGSASVLLDFDTTVRFAARSAEVDIIDIAAFDDDLLQIRFLHDDLAPGYNGQVEIAFEPWPDGPIKVVRRDTDT